MKTVSCTITLNRDANLSCVIDLTLDDKGRRTWALIDSPQRRLRLKSRSGSWRFHEDEPPTLMLRNDATGLFLAALMPVPRDFLDAVDCGKALSGGGNLTDPTRDIAFIISLGCA
jgi:hypothetical protein